MPRFQTTVSERPWVLEVVEGPQAKRKRGTRLSAHRVGELVSDIGREAGVKVATNAQKGNIKYASAQDLRRSFGERWATRIMPPDLMILMRHESISTTMRYYVGRNAQNTVGRSSKDDF